MAGRFGICHHLPGSSDGVYEFRKAQLKIHRSANVHDLRRTGCIFYGKKT